PSGKKYSLAFQQAPTFIMPVSEAVGTHPYIRLLVVAILGAGLCLLLTYHITKPIRRLRAATEDIASGKLKTGVDASVRRRHFQRVPESNASNSQGAGLGLAIADRVVRLHNGTIRAINAHDGGLIVEIVLPVIRSPTVREGQVGAKN